MQSSRYVSRRSAVWLIAAILATSSAFVQAQIDKTPDGLINSVSTDVLNSVVADKAVKAGDMSAVTALVDAKVMPYVDFRRMTAQAVGRYWRGATAVQRDRLQAAFKTLLIHTYSGALAQAEDHTVELQPMRSKPSDKEVVVRTLVKGSGDPIQLDYRLARAGDGGWKIYDVGVLGVWLVENYRNTFSQQISSNGIDSLIDKLEQRNRRNGEG